MKGDLSFDRLKAAQVHQSFERLGASEKQRECCCFVRIITAPELYKNILLSCQLWLSFFFSNTPLN